MKKTEVIQLLKEDYFEYLKQTLELMYEDEIRILRS